MPVSYILFTLMKILKEHKKKTTISIGLFTRLIGEFLIESNLSEETKLSLIDDLDMNYHFTALIDEYAGFVYNEDGMITLSPYISIDKIYELLEESSSEYSEGIIEEIDDFYDFNIPVLDLLGIKMETELYENIMNLESKIEDGYDSLARIEMEHLEVPSNMLYRLKKYVLMREFVFSQIEHSLSLDEYNDLYLYGKHRYASTNPDTLTLKLENTEFELMLEDDPYLRALFFIDNSREIAFTKNFYKVENEGERANQERLFSEVISIINRKTNTKEYDIINDDLILSKYRLMYIMDFLGHRPGKYDEYKFMNRKKELPYPEDYSFIEKEIFFLIDEIFEYSDEEMTDMLVADYENNIKSILIEAYYNLTGDERVISAIKNHPNYGKYYFVTKLFAGLVESKKKKTKRKEDE